MKNQTIPKIPFSGFYEILQTCQRGMLNAFAEGYHYSNWPDSFIRDNNREAVEKLQKYIHSYFKKFDPNSMNELLPLPNVFPEILAGGGERLRALGFAQWDATLWLIPLWMKPFLDPTAEVIAIDGARSTLADVDTNHRGGMLAYGFHVGMPVPKQMEETCAQF